MRRVTTIGALVAVLGASAIGYAAGHGAPPTQHATVATNDAPTTVRDAVIRVIDGDYLARAGEGILTDEQVAALLPVYGAAESTGLPCADMARTLQRTGDYRPDMRACFGDEDDPAVDVILASVGR